LSLVLAAAIPPSLVNAAEAPGGEPYQLTKGEWLCLLLNMDVAMASCGQQPSGMVIRYRYDVARPNTIQIEVLCSPNVGAMEVQRRAAVAEQRLVKAAKARGWDQWLKTEVRQTALNGPLGFESVDQ
jgi:hypothetical protein